MAPEIKKDRDVRLKLNGEGYVLSIQEETFKLTPGEARSLLTTLLHTMPEVPDGVNIAHEIRCGPRLIIERHWSAREDTISQNKFRAVVYVMNRKVDRTALCDSPEEARALASERYGKDLTIAATMDAPGARQAATKRANKWLIESFISRNDMTVPELFQAIKAGEVPEGLSLEVREI